MGCFCKEGFQHNYLKKCTRKLAYNIWT
jgi:hypothetical protein